jgi:rhodanese-related sulfurtransferase
LSNPAACGPVFGTNNTTEFPNMALFLEFLAQEWLLVLALLVVIVMLVIHEARKSGPSVTPQQAINLINAEQGVFVDLRDAADYKQGHIVEAVHIPSAKLAERLVELDKYKQRPVVLVCKMGQQASAAGKQLKAAGFDRVYKMTGGMMEWSNLQLPTVSKS